LDQARNKAKILIGQVVGGADPLLTRKKKREEAIEIENLDG